MASRLRPRSSRRWKRSARSCYDVKHWHLIWVDRSPDGKELSTDVFLGAEQFTREQALAFCEALQEWQED